MFRFTIRELVLVTLVVGLSVGWWLNCARLTNELHQAREGVTVLEAEKLRAETWAQLSRVAHNRTLRLIRDHGLVPVRHSDGTETLESLEGAPIKEGFN